jgi:hypothetical protein
LGSGGGKGSTKVEKGEPNKKRQEGKEPRRIGKWGRKSRSGRK